MQRHAATLLVVFASTLGCASAQRPAQAPDLVALDGALGNRFVPAAQRSDVVARIHISVPSTATLARPPMNVSLVIDTSGSMEGRAIDDARAASLALLDTLRDGDRFSVVTFDTRAAVLVPSVALDHDTRLDARQRIGQIEARGTTAMAEGLRLGVVEVMRHHNPAGINRVVLLGDGVPNDRAGIEETAASAGAHGVTITALGLGLDYDETLMGAVASRSGGRFHYVADSSAVAAVFRDEVLRMERVIARNAVATLIPGPGVDVEGVVGLEATRTAEGIVVSLGDVSEGAGRDIIVRMKSPSRRAGASVELLDVSLAYDDAVAGAGRIERRTFLGARATANEAERTSGRNEEVEQTAARLQLAAGTLAAIRDARAGNLDQARARIDAALDEAQTLAQHNRAMEGRVSSLRALRGALPSVAPSSDQPAAAPAAAVREAHSAAYAEITGN